MFVDTVLNFILRNGFETVVKDFSFFFHFFDHSLFPPYKVELLSREYTMAFPINLPSLSGTSGYLAFRIPQETLQSVSNDLIVELSTNRRRILKTQLTIPDLPKFLSR